MNVFELTRALVDVESVTGNEEAIGNLLFSQLSELASRHGGEVERLAVEPHRFNVLARWGDPVVTLSTHMDTVPPFFASREDAEHIWGRGACDTKGIIASMIFALRELLEEGRRNLALLLVVGEERNSAGALAAAKLSRGSKFLINGEPTENKLAIGSKGALRLELIAHGRMAHSAYPELGESAIEKLLDVLDRVRRLALPSDPVLGKSTLNRIADKLTVFHQILRQEKLSAEQAAYIGDDIIDLPIMEHCGLAIAVPNSRAEVLQAAHFVTEHPGGHGAVRDAVEFILKAQGKLQQVIDSYLQGRSPEKKTGKKN